MDEFDVESNYSGISNEDFEEIHDGAEELSEDLEEGDDATPACDDEGALSAVDSKEVPSTADSESASPVGDSEEILSAADAEEVFTLSDAEELLSAPNAKYSVPSSNEALSDEYDVSEAELSPLASVKEESVSASDAEPSKENTFYDEESAMDCSPVAIKEEPSVSDEEPLLPSFSHGTSGLSFGNVSHQEECKRRGGDSKSTNGGQRNSKAVKTVKVVLPVPYTGPREVDGKRFHCYYCKSSHKYKSRLVTHMETHFPSRHVCRKCGKAFRQRGTLESHRLVHDGVKFKCHVCDYAACSISKLQRHFIWHQENGSMAEMPIAKVMAESGWAQVSAGEKTSGEMNSSSRTKWAKKAKATKKLPPEFTGPREPGCGPFLCYHCPKAYPKKFFLREHMYAHLPPIWFCEVCGFGFALLNQLKTHVAKTHSREKPHECRLCSFKTSWKPSYVAHLAKMHDNPVRDSAGKPLLSCFYCGWTAKFKSRLVPHIDRHFRQPASHSESGKNAENGWTCEFCRRRHTSSVGLKAHLRRHSDDDFKCPKCQFASFQLKQFVVHLQDHEAGSADDAQTDGANDGKPYVCKLCNCLCESFLLFFEHMLFHFKAFKCSNCPYATYSKHGLEEHNKKHHLDVWYPCGSCDFKTRNPRYLKVHINAKHTRAEWYKCRFCPYQCLIPRNLHLHEAIHTGDKRYACDQCGSRFYRKTSLRCHLYTHTGERPYECDLCDYKGATTSAVVRHKKGKHSTERPFKCDFCGKSFKTAQTAKFHQLCHLGKNVHRCSECAYNTVAKAALDKHMLRMHSENAPEELPDTFPNGRKKTWYHCEKCAFVVCYKPSFERHMLKFHPTKIT